MPDFKKLAVSKIIPIVMCIGFSKFNFSFMFVYLYIFAKHTLLPIQFKHYQFQSILQREMRFIAFVDVFSNMMEDFKKYSSSNAAYKYLETATKYKRFNTRFVKTSKVKHFHNDNRIGNI